MGSDTHFIMTPRVDPWIDRTFGVVSGGSLRAPQLHAEKDVATDVTNSETDVVDLRRYPGSG